jgi:hypothetical protein
MATVLLLQGRWHYISIIRNGVIEPDNQGFPSSLIPLCRSSNGDGVVVFVVFVVGLLLVFGVFGGVFTVGQSNFVNNVTD